MIGPVALSRQFAREGRESSLQEVAEPLSGGINIFAVPVNEIHGYIERIVCITLVPQAILKNSCHHPAARAVSFRPYLPPIVHAPVLLPFRFCSFVNYSRLFLLLFFFLSFLFIFFSF